MTGNPDLKAVVVNGRYDVVYDVPCTLLDSDFVIMLRDNPGINSIHKQDGTVFRRCNNDTQQGDDDSD